MSSIDVRSLLAGLNIPIVRQAGEVFWCCCPLHGERTPSWFIRERPGDRFHAAWHCFAGETVVMTRDGDYPIRELAGREVLLLTARPDGNAEWVYAPVRSFGQQQLWEVTVRRNGRKKIIRATAGHRWFAKWQSSSPAWSELTTEQLKPGQSLRSACPPRHVGTPSPWGIAHGFTFGDGWQGVGGCSVTLWGEKDRALAKFFPLSPMCEAETPAGVKGLRVTGLPLLFKERPPLHESPHYLYGWLAGYFAADGSVDEDGHPVLCSADRENLEFVRTVCNRLGVFTYGIRSQVRTGFGVEGEMFILGFRRSSLTEEFFVVDEHRRRWLAHKDVRERARWVVVSVQKTDVFEEVFCAEVPDTHCFTLEDHLLTGNCYGCKESGWPVQLVQQMLKLKTQQEAGVWLRDMPAVEHPLPRRVQVIHVPMVRRLAVPAAVEFECWPARYADYLDGRMPRDQRDRWGLGFVRKDSESELADRVWIPAHDAGGRLLSYTARAIGKARRRYREPRREEGASGAAIFGELLWPSLPRDVVVVVEGAFNGLAVERCAPRPVAFAALMGSSLDTLQVLKLTTFGRVVLATDPDKAGEKAARALKAALARYTKVTQMPLPPGQDCDSIPPDDLRALLDSALSESPHVPQEHAPR